MNTTRKNSLIFASSYVSSNEKSNIKFIKEAATKRNLTIACDNQSNNFIEECKNILSSKKENKIINIFGQSFIQAGHEPDEDFFLCFRTNSPGFYSVEECVGLTDRIKPTNRCKGIIFHITHEYDLRLLDLYRDTFEGNIITFDLYKNNLINAACDYENLRITSYESIKNSLDNAKNLSFKLRKSKIECVLYTPNNKKHIVPFMPK